MSRGVRLTIGIVMIVLGGLALLGAGGLLAVFGFDNTATSPTFRITGNGRAVVWGTGSIRHGTPLPARYTTTLSLHVRAGDKDVFVGIGPTNEVARYLAGAATDRATSVGWPARVIVTTPQPGQAVPPPPDQQTFWVAKASGSGTQSVDWSIEAGTWAVVIMNADASAGVDVLGRGSLKIGAITPIMIVLAVIGLGLVAGGIVVLVTGRRRNRYDADEPARPDPAVPPASA
jgi:hypothetical protein